MTKQLILGGARSGKSRFAETQALATNKQLIYVATATAGDSEMQQRILHHQADRDSAWHLHEETVDLAAVLTQFNDKAYCLLIDCLTLWLSNCLHQQCWPLQKQSFVDQLAKLDADIIMVSNEVGSGVVPLGQLSRQFVDESGHLHQELASVCQHVKLIVAGLPLTLK